MLKLKVIRALLIAFAALTFSAAAFAQIQVSVSFGPPELPVYEQPQCPGDGYMWTPGYWAWDGAEYYWVPGTWVMAPQPGYLWTPGYWAWNGNGYYFNQGYWAPEVGYYGGIDYGWGYPGHGYYGGRWQDDRFYYNRSVNNVDVTNIRYVYNTTVVNNYNRPRVSYNGGQGGVNAQPSPEEQRAAHERHIAPVPAQVQHREQAQADPALRASQNHGKPPVAATPRPTDFRGNGVVPAREGGNYNPPARAENNNQRVPRPENSGQQQHPENNARVPRPENNEQAPRPENGQPPRPGNNNQQPAHAVHPNDLPPVRRGNTPDTGNSKNDQKYQQQQEKFYTKQEQQRQKLENQQEQQHQRAQGNPDQQMEQHHEQQTQKLEQRQAQQQQKFEAQEQSHQGQPRTQAQQQPHPQPQERPEPRGEGRPQPPQ